MVLAAAHWLTLYVYAVSAEGGVDGDRQVILEFKEHQVHRLKEGKARQGMARPGKGKERKGERGTPTSVVNQMHKITF